MSGTTLNQASAHDTGLYDPTVHDNQIVALYETDAEARSAMDVLTKAGFSAHAMQVLGRDGSTGSSHEGTTGASNEGLWGSIKSLFVPDEDRTTYNSAIARGHAMLVVTPDSTMDRQHLIHTLESTNPLDFDAKLEEWRQTGYDTSATGTTTSGMGVSGSTVGLDADRVGVRGTPATTAAATGTGYAATGTTGATSPDTIKMMEEKLRVGKREVASGAVRIRSYIVERPVEESVSLREERVSIERHPVDRAANPADFAAFQERTIEARATSEEAVVAKEARVVEEIGVNKTASDRTETVRDTVRKTEVEIEGDTASKSGTLGGTTTTLNPNATPGVGTSGANSPRK